MIKGVKAAKAAFIIERGVRRHQASASAARTKGMSKQIAISLLTTPY